MKDFTLDEIKKMDEILIFLNTNRYNSFQNSFLADKFEVSLEKFDFFYHTIVEFSLNNTTIGNILDKNTSYASIQCNYSTERFINNGGFKNYIETHKKNESSKKKSEQSIKAKNIVINNGKINSLKQKNISEKKTRWDIIGSIGLIIAILTFIFGDNLFDKIKNNFSVNKQQIETTEFIGYNTKIKLPYLESVPILDKGLFIKQHYSNFVLGGPNLNNIKLNARKENGEKIEIKVDNNSNLILEIFDNPYIEFQYKKEYYSIQVKTENMGDNFDCVIKKVKKPTLDLIKF